MEQSKRNTLIVIGLGILLVITIIISFRLGRYPIPAKEVLGILLSKIYPIELFWTDRVEMVLINIRLPRIILACLVGCCLSAAGAAYQGVFQNPMAAPDILGASAGAAFGAALAILNYGSRFMITVSAFFFSLLTVSLVYLISKRVKGKSILGLILSGIIVGSLFSAGTSFIKLVADPTDQLPAITYWLMGSLAGAKMGDIKFAIIPMIIGLVPLLLIRWRLNVLTMGDDEARTMGVNANQIRIIVIICATLTTAASVSVSGMIGWVGLVIPHLARKLVGNNYNHLMPASILFGAIFLLLVDNVSRNLLTTEIPLGILTAFVGAPFFIYLITREVDAF
ncbi:MAG TPA: iron ABC transporter permease [Syntrophaceticus sp.]|uniref:Putative iron transport protein (ABC superfamily, membrane) n=1 Tax=Syntrophaceticus schinkii TaxID=499207 RepID=A0A0B7MKP4_9FIRM|nr:iron ABC transporter permease [Syntrophaceticus schinkii]HHY29710.1 iron ABC transporter permease [Syntrophaceticus sp.]MDD2358835.1 iron ABC transporter permease [Syntrophaceticus schinkii]MDD4260815.1 iron ABC transporter permease [Syntrophaceticus schinkii]MDD4674132.1 iron ABC transporter permease [Syntrophaceticus schinkii]CEO88222.1 putative iron transport protein (ABC superfamily, membrane) [Syntrophaceticus schinkii]